MAWQAEARLQVDFPLGMPCIVIEFLWPGYREVCMASNRLTVEERDRLTYEEVARRYRLHREPVTTPAMLERMKDDLSTPEKAEKVAQKIRHFVKTGEV